MPEPTAPAPRALRHWAGGLACFLLTVGLAFGLRMLEWPSWQNPEYRLGGEMLLATHDAYHWVAGAEGFGLAVEQRFLSWADRPVQLPKTPLCPNHKPRKYQEPSQQY